MNPLLLSHCLLLLPLCEVCFLIGSLFSNVVLMFFLVNSHLPEEERAGCLTLIVFLLLCGCLCSVSIPRNMSSMLTWCIS